MKKFSCEKSPERDAAAAPADYGASLAGMTVGVLDSGLGGLSVLEALRGLLPEVRFVYCADCANAPWGEKTQQEIISRCRAICGFLIDQGAQAVVLACNTATAMAADGLRAELTQPVIGIEPAVKPAVRMSRRHAVGVLATTRTIESPRYARLLERFARDARVVSAAAPGLMECVEAGALDAAHTRRLLETYLAPMKRAGVDALVLGCTHYPFLRETIASIMGPGVALIEPGPAVAAVTKTRLGELAQRQQRARPQTASGDCRAPITFYVKGARGHAAVLRRLWPEAGDVLELPV